MKYSHLGRSINPFHIGVYVFWALLATLCWFASVSCQAPDKTTVIREVPVQQAPPPQAPGVDVKIQDGKNGGVEVDVHGKTPP